MKLKSVTLFIVGHNMKYFQNVIGDFWRLNKESFVQTVHTEC